MERLQKVLAKAGIASRRKAEELIIAGQVSVDDEIVTTLGYIVKEGSVVKYNGVIVESENKVYYLLHKPRRVICSLKDERDRKTVIDLIESHERVFPVGRLDYDTSGVLLLTNDGEFANEMTHPRYHLPKTYQVTINGILTSTEINQLENGIVLDDGTMTLPAKLRVTGQNITKTTMDFELIIQEGKNRQIKRMIEALNYNVIRLHRSKLAFIDCKDLNPGEYRSLTLSEIKRLKEFALSGVLK